MWKKSHKTFYGRESIAWHKHMNKIATFRWINSISKRAWGSHLVYYLLCEPHHLVTRFLSTKNVEQILNFNCLHTHTHQTVYIKNRYCWCLHIIYLLKIHILPTSDKIIQIIFFQSANFHIHWNEFESKSKSWVGWLKFWGWTPFNNEIK